MRGENWPLMAEITDVAGRRDSSLTKYRNQRFFDYLALT